MTPELLEDPEGASLRRRMSISLLAGLPLFALYEFGVSATAAAGAPLRNSSELFLSQWAELAGGGAAWRWLALALVLGLCALRVALQRWPLGDGVLWSLLEGAGLGLLLAPVMMLLLGSLGWRPNLDPLLVLLLCNGNGRGDFARLVVLLGHGARRSS